MHSPVVYEQGCRVTGCLQRRRRQQVTAAMTFTKNNLSKSDEEHACASKKEKRQRETDGVCCRVPSLWNLGYSSTAAGPACAHPVYLPCAGQRVNHLRGVNIQTAELYPPAVLLLRPGKTVLLITESTTFSKQLTVYKKKQKKKLQEHCSWSSFIQIPGTCGCEETKHWKFNIRFYSIKLHICQIVKSNK